MSVVPCETQEFVDFLHIVCVDPLLDSAHFHLVHPYFSFHNLHPQEVEVDLLECTLFWVQMGVILF